MRHLRTSGIALLVLVWVFTIVVATAGPLIAHLLGTIDPSVPVTRPYDPPSASHLLGTDVLGRDVLARMLQGNIGLIIPPSFAALVSTAIGAALAMASALFPRGRPVIKFVTDILIIIPAMVILLAVITATGGSFFAVAVAAILLSVPLSTKYLGAAAQPLVHAEFVDVARVHGTPTWKIVVGDILPALRRPLLADLGVRFVTIVFLSATAAFLVGASGSSEATWAGMVGSNLGGINLNHWAVTAPVVAIAALTACPALLLDQLTGGRR